jgi:hypothetical protein
MALAAIIERCHVYRKHRLRASCDRELLGFFYEGTETVSAVKSNL